MLNIPLALLLVLSVQDPEAPKVGELFESLIRAMAGKDGDDLPRCFHARRMLQEMEKHGFGTPAATKEMEELKIKALHVGLRQFASASKGDAAWEKIRVLNLQVLPTGVEAIAATRVTVGGERTRIRFWLAKEDAAWKIYDFEMQEGNLRLSVMMGAVWAGMEGDEKARKAVLLSFMALQRAAIELQSGDVEKAQARIQKALASKAPAFIKGWLEVLNAGAFIGLGESEEAIKAADRALEHQKDLHLAHLMKAQALFELENFEKCIESARAYVTGCGDDPEAWKLIGDAHDKLSDRKEAMEAYRKGAASDDEEFANRLSLGKLLIAEGKGTEAVAVLKEASKNAPAEEGAFEEAAEMLDGAGQPAAVLEMAREFGKRSPDEPNAFFWEAKALRKLKRFDEAEKVLRSALGKDFEDSRFDGELVFTLAQAGKDAEAMKHVDKVASDDADRARFLRAFVHVSAGRAGKAIDELKAMLDADPSAVDEIEKEPAFEKLRKDADFQVVLGRAKAAREYETAAEEKVDEKEWEALLKMARERVAAAPDHAVAHYHQGLALRHLGRAFDAELAFKAAIAKAKDRVPYREELGKALAAQGKIDEAIAVADEILQDAERKLSGLHLKVAVYAIAKKSEPALKALAELLKEDPDWYRIVESDDDLEELRKLEGCQVLLKKAKAKSEE